MLETNFKCLKIRTTLKVLCHCTKFQCLEIKNERKECIYMKIFWETKIGRFSKYLAFGFIKCDYLAYVKGM